MDKEQLEILKLNREIEREKYLKEVWENLKPIKTRNDILTLPRVDEDAWRNYYVPKLIAAGAIPKKDLVDGEYYVGDHRCTGIAKWNQGLNVFEYWKWKFFPMWDDCNHFEDDDGFALFVPIGIGKKEDFDKYGYDAWLKEKEQKKNEDI
jgi:hypothetical protein